VLNLKDYLTYLYFESLKSPEKLDLDTVGHQLCFYRKETFNKAPVLANEEKTLYHENPVKTDVYGKFPAIYLDDGEYTVHLLDRNSVVLWIKNAVYPRPEGQVI